MSAWSYSSRWIKFCSAFISALAVKSRRYNFLAGSHWWQRGVKKTNVENFILFLKGHSDKNALAHIPTVQKIQILITVFWSFLLYVNSSLQITAYLAIRYLREFPIRKIFKIDAQLGLGDGKTRENIDNLRTGSHLRLFYHAYLHYRWYWFPQGALSCKNEDKWWWSCHWPAASLGTATPLCIYQLVAEGRRFLWRHTSGGGENIFIWTCILRPGRDGEDEKVGNW